jgi:hypothetical protein
MKDFEDIKKNISNAFAGSYDRNQMCLDDIEFAVVDGAMWKASLHGSNGSALEEQFKNKPKPEVNKIFQSINRLLGQKQRLEMNAKIVSNSEEATDEGADLLQSRWRNDFQSGHGSEAVDNADFEAFYGGFGAVKLVAKYEDEESPRADRQNLALEPVYSAASSVAFGPSLKKDKSDSKWCVQIIRTNREDIEEEYGADSVTSINNSVDWFDWNTDSSKDLYLAHYYEVTTKKITEYRFGDYIIATGDGIKDQYNNKVTREELADLREANEHEVVRKTVKYVEYALLSGDGFLEAATKTPFKRVPIIPQYGYYCVINGIEYYCGEVRKRRDPAMFYNTFYSSMMEIIAAPQIQKPEYLPEQMARHGANRARADIDGVPYLLSDPVKDVNGNITHVGPIGQQQPPQLGSGLAAAGQLLQGDLMEMSGSGQSTVPANASEGAIQQVNERQDDAFQILIQSSMAAIKAACEVWLDAAKVHYFSNSRSLRVVSADGSYSQVKTLQNEMSKDGVYGAFKNNAIGSYSVQVKAGETHKSKKEAELDTTLKMLQFADTGTPQGQMLLNQAIMATTGEGGEKARKIANYQTIDLLLSMGIDPEPETDEEKQYIEMKMQSSQSQQPSAQEQAMLMEGKAREMEGQAAIQNEVNDANKIQIDAYNAETKRQELQIKAAEASVKIQNIEANTEGKDIDNQLKMKNSIVNDLKLVNGG